jgi:hypothetical protein
VKFMTRARSAHKLVEGNCTLSDPSTSPLKPAQHWRQAPWQMYEAATVNALQKLHQTIWQTYAAGHADEDQTTVRLLRVGIALQRANRARGISGPHSSRLRSPALTDQRVDD